MKPGPYNQSSTILSSKSVLDQKENILNPFYASWACLAQGSTASIHLWLS